jgi:uncharacterized protein (TIGR02246 family)
MELVRIIKLATFLAVILLAMPNLPIVAAEANGATESMSSVEDEKALRAQANDYVKAFANGDYKTIANMWASDGSLIDIEGRVLRGRAAIEKYFKGYFDNCGGQALEIAIDSIKFPGNDMAVEEGHSRLMKGPDIDDINQYTVVHLKRDNQWQMYSVTEAPYPPGYVGSLNDWQWLIGNWSAHPSAAKTINIRASWATGHKFIRCLFETDNSSGNKDFAMVVIGQDPSNGRIISWHFDPSGGYGSGKWTNDGQTWIERAQSIESNGAQGSAIYTLHKLDNNNFTWSSTQRVLNNADLPDSEEIKVSRQLESSE